MNAKKSSEVRKSGAKNEPKRLTRQGAAFLEPIDVDQKGPDTPGAGVETKSVMEQRYPELFQTEEHLVEEKEGKNYATFNYNMSYLFAEATQKSRVVKILTRDDRLELLDEDENGWIKVRTMTHPQVEGYVKTVFVKGD